jgi:hypothetical protein
VICKKDQQGQEPTDLLAPAFDQDLNAQFPQIQAYAFGMLTPAVNAKNVLYTVETAQLQA